MAYLSNTVLAITLSIAVGLATMALLLGIEIGRTPLQIVASTGVMFWSFITAVHYVAVFIHQIGQG